MAGRQPPCGRAAAAVRFLAASGAPKLGALDGLHSDVVTGVRVGPGDSWALATFRVIRYLL